METILLPHPGRGSQQLLLSRTDTFGPLRNSAVMLQLNNAFRHTIVMQTKLELSVSILECQPLFTAHAFVYKNVMMVTRVTIRVPTQWSSKYSIVVLNE